MGAQVEVEAGEENCGRGRLQQEVLAASLHV